MRTYMARKSVRRMEMKQDNENVRRMRRMISLMFLVVVLENINALMV